MQVGADKAHRQGERIWSSANKWKGCRGTCLPSYLAMGVGYLLTQLVRLSEARSISSFSVWLLFERKRSSMCFPACAALGHWKQNPSRGKETREAAHGALVSKGKGGGALPFPLSSKGHSLPPPQLLACPPTCSSSSATCKNKGCTCKNKVNLGELGHILASLDVWSSTSHLMCLLNIILLRYIWERQRRECSNWVRLQVIPLFGSYATGVRCSLACHISKNKPKA